MSEQVNQLHIKNDNLLEKDKKMKQILNKSIISLKDTQNTLLLYKESVENYIEFNNDIKQQIIEKIQKGIKDVELNIKTQEEKKTDKVEIRKSVIPANYKKKISNLANKGNVLDLEKELGNSFNN